MGLSQSKVSSNETALVGNDANTAEITNTNTNETTASASTEQDNPMSDSISQQEEPTGNESSLPENPNVSNYVKIMIEGKGDWSMENVSERLESYKLRHGEDEAKDKVTNDLFEKCANGMVSFEDISSWLRSDAVWYGGTMERPGMISVLETQIALREYDFSDYANHIASLPNESLDGNMVPLNEGKILLMSTRRRHMIEKLLSSTDLVMTYTDIGTVNQIDKSPRSGEQLGEDHLPAEYFAFFDRRSGIVSVIGKHKDGPSDVALDRFKESARWAIKLGAVKVSSKTCHGASLRKLHNGKISGSYEGICLELAQEFSLPFLFYKFHNAYVRREDMAILTAGGAVLVPEHEAFRISGVCMNEQHSAKGRSTHSNEVGSNYRLGSYKPITEFSSDDRQREIHECMLYARAISRSVLLTAGGLEADSRLTACRLIDFARVILDRKITKDEYDIIAHGNVIFLFLGWAVIDKNEVSPEGFSCDSVTYGFFLRELSKISGEDFGNGFETVKGKVLHRKKTTRFMNLNLAYNQRQYEWLWEELQGSDEEQENYKQEELDLSLLLSGDVDALEHYNTRIVSVNDQLFELGEIPRTENGKRYMAKMEGTKFHFHISSEKLVYAKPRLVNLYYFLRKHIGPISILSISPGTVERVTEEVSNAFVADILKGEFGVTAQEIVFSAILSNDLKVSNQSRSGLYKALASDEDGIPINVLYPVSLGRSAVVKEQVTNKVWVILDQNVAVQISGENKIEKVVATGWPTRKVERIHTVEYIE